MERCLLIRTLPLAVGLTAAAPTESTPAEFRFKEESLHRLVQAVPTLLRSQDPKTGRFGRGIWIVTDQNVIYPLAAAWAIQSDSNPYYHDPKVLEAVMAGGDALIDDADANGQWEFRKKDGSTWGKIYMPWTYSRWIRAFGLIREAMPPERRARWEKALLLGYSGIARTALGHVHNIPTHHAMGLYHAGQLFERQEWCQQAKDFMAKVVAAQNPGGFWSEHHGPVVAYNFVYSEALGIYYALSGDRSVLPALERAARFHAAFTYPDGSIVETVDERNPYHGGVHLGNVGFTFTSAGRGYLARQFALAAQKGRGPDADECASLLLYGEEGPAEPTAAEAQDHTFVLGNREALIRRKGPWFICLSAYHCPVPENRWHQDRQNLVSIFHDRAGLIVGGGNTKLQPLWSNFTVGDTALLHHQPGDPNPKFTPPPGLTHVPSAATLSDGDPPSLRLEYNGEACRVAVEPVDDRRIRLRLQATTRTGAPVQAHVTLLPHLGQTVHTSSGIERKLSEEAFTLGPGDTGGWIAHAGWRLSLPDGARVTWPVLPHNPYRKGGEAEVSEGRLVVSIPFATGREEAVLTLEVEGGSQ